MNKIFSLNKYCREVEIDVNSLVKICKRSGIDVYTVGTSHYTENSEAVDKALLLEMQRKKFYRFE